MNPGIPGNESSSLVAHLSSWGALGLIRLLAESPDAFGGWLAEHHDEKTLPAMIAYVDWLVRIRDVEDRPTYYAALQDLISGLLRWSCNFAGPVPEELVAAAQTINELLARSAWSWPSDPSLDPAAPG